MKNVFKGWKCLPVYIFDIPWNDNTSYVRVMSEVHVDLMSTWGKQYYQDYYIGRSTGPQLTHMNRFWLWNTMNYLVPFYKTKKTWG